ncbi:hypothetical protein [Microbispora triticiradicis]|uniref:ParB/Sulfiredoxin domain-containing protein n=2 Tax=Microbispora TaxID=2005 RepID=A0ABY3LTS4_9ACTN|nr:MULTISPECIES: hypothetical protein [Microbispora]TLP57858.1 hypothetical protein FED44_20045 [Microbispora fusca]TYB52326.1 hypothetical protein FXF59_24930 [Microbispora tritici]
MTTTRADASRDDTEAFRFLAWAWNVTAAKAYAEGRTPEGRLSPRAWAGFLSAIWINEDHISEVDLSAPLIAVPIPNAGPLIIDGWHRIARALREQVTELPVIILTEQEEYACRIYGGDKAPTARFR